MWDEQRDFGSWKRQQDICVKNTQPNIAIMLTSALTLAGGQKIARVYKQPGKT